jgi:hypothetical protein
VSVLLSYDYLALIYGEILYYIFKALLVLGEVLPFDTLPVFITKAFFFAGATYYLDTLTCFEGIPTIAFNEFWWELFEPANNPSVIGRFE